MAVLSPSTFSYAFKFRKKLFNDGRDCFIWHSSQLCEVVNKDFRLSHYLIGISCFLGLVKAISSNTAIGAWVFLLLVANGGLLQALWLWRNSVGYKDEESRESEAAHLGHS